LNHVVKITHEFEKSKKIGVEIEIEQLKNVW
jgi:hypothetical protein